MKISLKWLNEYVNVNDYFAKPKELASLLTVAGLEVESVEYLGQDFENVVVGQILEKKKHPEADKLTVCQVTTGQERSHTIICGAKNHNAKDYVIVALPGANLPCGLKIKKSKIRGIESEGMLCSFEELGMSEKQDKNDGIIILPQKLPENIEVGLPAAQYFDLDDTIFELKVTPNRADCLSHCGLAREVAALLGSKFKWEVEKLKTTSQVSTLKKIGLEVKNPDMCPRYAGRLIEGVKVGESPHWLKQRLESVGINSINNIVDVTNYVMLELGQPLHAFDREFLEGQKIIVEMSQSKEKFVTLDETQIHLTGQELMIRDKVKPIALAGVVGGANSGVRQTTKDLFIESAYFLPITIRKTSKRFGIDTDSAYRFARGINPEVTLMALDRACQLITKLAGGQVSKDYYDHYPSPLKRETICLQMNYVCERLGYEVSKKTIKEDLIRIGCEIVKSDDKELEVLPPMYRWDITMDMDLIEEVARLQGYDKIPETLPVMSMSPKAHDKQFIFHNHVSDLLSSIGFRQVVNHSFVSSEFQSQVLGNISAITKTGLPTDTEAVKISNPISEELNVMRLSLIPGLLKNLSFNNNHGNNYGRLFETGFSFGKKEDLYNQAARLGLAAWGHQVSLWQKSENHPVVFELKAGIEKLLTNLGISSWSWVQEDQGPDFLHTGQRVILKCEGKLIGYVGTLNPKWKNQWKLRVDVAVGELALDVLGLNQPRVRGVQGVSKFPCVKRDLSLLMPNDLPVSEVVKTIKKSCGSVLKGVEIFDSYQGSHLETGQRSVGFRMEYQDKMGTLDEKGLLELQNGILETVKKKFSIGMR